MFPVHARCSTFDAGYKMERAKAQEHLELGKVYTIRQMNVGSSSSWLEFYEVAGQWNTVFFEAVDWEDAWP